MNDSPLQLAKREWHAFSRSRAAWVSTLAAGILLGVAGPFGTDEVMRLLPRIAYWSVLAVLTYLTGSMIDAVLRPALARHLPFWGVIPIVGAASGLVITGQILALNGVLFGFWPGIRGTVILGGNVFVASMVITGAATLILRDVRQQATASSDAREDPRILDRLPLAKRGALLSLTAVDHYVEVTTDRGSELVLMRLADAIRETAPVPGLQIHRSHWVARDHVDDIKRIQGRTEVVLSDGRTLPVSRANVPKLKEAGLLPR